MKGFSLVEALIFGAISCFALVCVAQWLAKPYLMQQTLTASEEPREATLAMDRLVNDLKEAAPGSMRWDLQSSTAPLVFAKSWINPDTKQVVPYALMYGYEGPVSGPGQLVRLEASTSTIILEPIDPPTPQAPLFVYDPAVHVVTVDIRYHRAGKAAMRLVRRVSLTQ